MTSYRKTPQDKTLHGLLLLGCLPLWVRAGAIRGWSNDGGFAVAGEGRMQTVCMHVGVCRRTYYSPSVKVTRGQVKPESWASVAVGVHKSVKQ